MSSEAASTGGSGKARIVIADDHDLVRSGLRSMLAREPDLEVIGEARDGQEAVELCERTCPDLVLMDLRMPRMDGLEATRALKSKCPLISVLVVTMQEDPDLLFEALKAGVAGYVLKDSTRQELLGTVRGVLAGESPLDPRLASRLLKRLADETQQKEETARRDEEDLAAGQRSERREEASLPEPLTEREKEALRLMAQGQTNKEIAKDMIVSEGTAKHHVRRILAKLRASDRTQAVVRAIEMGLLIGLLPPSG